MDKDYYIELLERFIQRGDIQAGEREILYKWFQSRKANETISQYYQQKWLSSSEHMPEEVQNRILDELVSKINFSEDDDRLASYNEDKKQRFSLPFRGRLRYIAVAATLISVIFGSLYYTKRIYGIHEEMIVFAEKGQTSKVQLPDGTIVWLNSQSQLTYNNSFNISQRTLKLKGEAYFEVAKNKSIPFEVLAGEVKIKALGTAFNVKSYPNENELSVTLLEGKVDVSDDQMNIILQPDEYLIYDQNKRHFSKKELSNATNVLSWRKGGLTFDDAPLEKICMDLSRIYNIKFSFTSPEIKQHTFSGVINNNNLNNVLEIISLTVPIKYTRIDNETIEISKK